MRHWNNCGSQAGTYETVLNIVRERLTCLRCPSGFLLDGFPRTVAQAEALEKLLQKEKLALTAVLNYELPLDEILARLGGRTHLLRCKAVFHVVNLPLGWRVFVIFAGPNFSCAKDDRPESIRVRMEAYERSTRPLIDFYRQRGLLVTVVVGKVPEETYQRTMKAPPSSPLFKQILGNCSPLGMSRIRFAPSRFSA